MLRTNKTKALSKKVKSEVCQFCGSHDPSSCVTRFCFVFTEFIQNVILTVTTSEAYLRLQVKNCFVSCYAIQKKKKKKR